MIVRTRILVTGGTGSIGSQLCDFLSRQDFEISVLSRSRTGSEKYPTFLWDYKKGFIEPNAFDACDYIVHLAGAGIADKRWSKERKKEILDSRVRTTRLIHKALSSRQHAVKGIISASAVGYYGQTTAPMSFKETDPPGNDFVAEVCKAWEDEVSQFREISLRTVNLRIGIVLMKEGGALEKMAQPFHWNLGAVLGSGKQFIPWIHIDDLNQIITKAIVSPDMTGAYNCCAPQAVDNAAFSKNIAAVLGKKIWLPKVPSFILSMMLGERSVLLTEGSKVSSERILQTGYAFKFPEIRMALKDLLG